MGYQSPSYTISCLADADSLHFLDLEMTWVFKRYDRNSSDGYALKAVRFPSSDASPNGIQIIAHVLAMSKFTIGTPSRKLEGLYYCEWTTKTFVHRSPAIDLRLTGQLIQNILIRTQAVRTLAKNLSNVRQH